MTTNRIAAGETFPSFSAKASNGESVTIGTASGQWQLLVVYRGKHCGRCKQYLNILESMQHDWHEAGFSIQTVSADPLNKALEDITEFGWTFPVACELAEQDMRKLGLYVSDPLSPDETDRRFAEPAVFCLRPDGTIQIVAISNGPSARPELAQLLDGMAFTIKHNKPARGMATLA